MLELEIHSDKGRDLLTYRAGFSRELLGSSALALPRLTSLSKQLAL
jgi:hypothetical protein